MGAETVADGAARPRAAWETASAQRQRAGLPDCADRGRDVPGWDEGGSDVHGWDEPCLAVRDFGAADRSRARRDSADAPSGEEGRQRAAQARRDFDYGHDELAPPRAARDLARAVALYVARASRCDAEGFHGAAVIGGGAASRDAVAILHAAAWRAVEASAALHAAACFFAAEYARYAPVDGERRSACACAPVAPATALAVAAVWAGRGVVAA